MRSLTLIRHAKSSHDHSGLQDYYRSLNERGYMDAPQMGRYLRSALQWKPDLIISSSATRALSTARLIAESADYDSALIHPEPTIYEASSMALLTVIQRAPETVQHLCLVGHNPGMEQISNLLLGEIAVTDFVTCGVVMLALDVANWQSTRPGSASLLRFLTPRSLWGRAE